LDIGATLKTVRKARGLSQRELAKRAGVTNSTISMIEKNSVSPSVSSLEKVLSGIPLSLPEFFASASSNGSGPKTVYLADELPDVGHEGVIRQLVGADLPFRSLTLINHHYPPQSGPSRFQQRDGELAGIIIEGRLELSIDQERHTLGPGDCFYMESDRPHRLRNPFDQPCRLVSASTRTGTG
jgi:transcriptional regulator with XRE-family HTH domain